jgi:hypothetical protein
MSSYFLKFIYALVFKIKALHDFVRNVSH